MSDYDVVVLGSGIAGLSATLAAHEAGLKPLLLEKFDLLGGGTTNSYGLIWVGENHLQLQSGLEDSRDDIVKYMRFLGGGELNEERMTTFVDQSPAVLKRFADWGIPFRLVRGVTDHYFGMAPGAIAEGRTLEAELISGFDLGEWKDRIVIPDDVPCYITAEEQVTWGGMNRFSQWDQDVVRERKARDMRGKGLGLVCHFVKALSDRKIPIMTRQKVESLTFDGKRVIGVRMEGGETINAAKGVVLATGGYDWNVELAKGLEGLPNLVPMGPESLTGDGLVLGAEVGAMIFDQQYLNQFSFGNRPVGSPVPDTIPRANNLPALAKRLGVDADRFVATIEQFNCFARSGVDQDFHRGELKWKLASSKGQTGKNPALGTIEVGPFYGVELLPSIGNSAGLLANAEGQVMHRRQRPIPGLYASGVVAARDEGGAGYQAGLTLAAAMTFSYLAVQHMVGEAARS